MMRNWRERGIIVLLFVLSLLVYITSASLSEGYSSSVVDIKSSNLDNILAQNDIVVIKYYAKWCIRSKMMEAEYEKAAQHPFPGKVKFGQVDGTAESKIRTKYNIGAYPIIQLHRKGLAPLFYKGRNDARGMVDFVNRGIGTMLKDLNTQADVDLLLSIPVEDVLVIAYIPKTSTRERYNFMEIAKAMREKVLFGITSNPELLASRFGSVPAEQGVLIYKPVEKIVSHYVSNDVEGDSLLRGNFSIRSLSSWLMGNIKLPVNFVHPENIQKYLHEPAALLFIDTLDAVGMHDSLSIFYKSAKAHSPKDTLNFIYTDGMMYKPFMERLGLRRYPSVAIIDVAKERQYLYSHDRAFDVDTLTAFYSEVLSESHLHFIRPSRSVVRANVDLYRHQNGHTDDIIGASETAKSSADLDDVSRQFFSPQKGKVKPVDEINLGLLLAMSPNSVLVNFHAPWCGFCKSIMPVFRKVSEVLSDTNVDLAEYDVSLNGLRMPFNSTASPNGPNALPFLLLFKKKADSENNYKIEEIAYEGDVSVEALLAFLKSNLSGFL